MRRCVLVLALIALCGPAAAQDGRIILAPVDGGTWEGSFVLQEPAHGVRVRYASSSA